MRVGLIIYGDLDLVSGGNLYDRTLVDHLRDAGHDVDIVSLTPGSYLRHLTQNFSPTLARRLVNAHFDVLLEDELVHPSLFRINERLRRSVTYPIVSIVHHLRSSEEWPEWQIEWYRRIEKCFLQSVDAFVFNSHTTRESVEELLQKKTRNVVATPGGDRLAPGLSRDTVLARAREPGPLRLLFVGNLIPRKGLHVLLEALAELARPEATEPSWMLDVVGSVEMDRRYARSIRSQIERLQLAPHVTIHGTLGGENLAERFRDAHVCVVPSSYEGFGIVYLEAMSFGLPVIAGAAGAADEIVQHESTGFLVPPGDTFSLRMQLQRLVEDRELLARLSVTALEKFIDHPTWEQSMTNVEEFLKELTGEKAAGSGTRLQR